MSSSSSDTDETGWDVTFSSGADFAVAPVSRPGEISALTVGAVQKHDQESREWRHDQFGCACGELFWRRVDTTRPQAHCKNCRAHLKPVARKLVIGYAKFNCPCGNRFSNNRAMYDCPQPCRKCRAPVLPKEPVILPPLRYGMVPDSASDDEVTLSEEESRQSSPDIELSGVDDGATQRVPEDEESFTRGAEMTGAYRHGQKFVDVGKRYSSPSRPELKEGGAPVSPNCSARADREKPWLSKQQDKRHTASALHDTAKHQFECKKCYRRFWHSPTGSPAICHRCKLVAEIVPRELVVGFAFFRCSCGNTFSSRKAMYDKPMKCNKCGKGVDPEEPIKPPQQQKKSYYHHECSRCPTGECKVRPISLPYDCTGDTVMSDVNTELFKGRRKDEPPNHKKYEQEILADYTAGRLYLADNFN